MIRLIHSETNTIVNIPFANNRNRSSIVLKMLIDDQTSKWRFHAGNRTDTEPVYIIVELEVI